MSKQVTTQPLRGATEPVIPTERVGTFYTIRPILPLPNSSPPSSPTSVLAPKQFLDVSKAYKMVWHRMSVQRGISSGQADSIS